MVHQDGYLYTSFVRPYTDETTGLEYPSHLAEFYVTRDTSGDDKLFAFSNDPGLQGFKFYVGTFSDEGFTVAPELSDYNRIDKNVQQDYDELYAAYRRWLNEHPKG